MTASTDIEHLRFMKAALQEANKAAAKDEVPVGCVIVKAGKIIARGHNQREARQSALAHAELIAIAKAQRKVGSWRLEDTTIYVTLEPCAMCAGAIIQARIPRLVYGAKEPKFGAHASVLNLFGYPFNHRVEVETGIMETEISTLMKTFFRRLRD